MSSSIKQFLNQIHPVEDSILDEYMTHWRPYSVPRKTILTFEGDIEKYLYFVISGVQKSYYLNNGVQHIIAFTYPPSFSGIPESFLTQTPSKYFLQSITASSFMRLSYSQHALLLDKYRPIETLFRKATEHILKGLVQRHYELMAYDIETRFRSFAKRSPHLFNMVTQKDLASYLRIDPTNFSKLLGSVKI